MKALHYPLDTIKQFSLAESVDAEHSLRRHIVLERAGRELAVSKMKSSDLRKMKKNLAQVLTLRVHALAKSSASATVEQVADVDVTENKNIVDPSSSQLLQKEISS